MTTGVEHVFVYRSSTIGTVEYTVTILAVLLGFVFADEL